MFCIQRSSAAVSGNTKIYFALKREMRLCFNNKHIRDYTLQE